MQSEVTITADIDHEFYTATADGADTVRLAAGKVEIFGNDYTCEAGLSTGLESADMVICSGNASQDAVLEAKDGSVKFTTEGDNTLLLRLIHEVDQKKVDLTDAHNITVTDTTTSGIVNVDVDGETQAYQVIPNDNESIVSSGSVNKTVFWKINKEGVLSIYGEGPMANYGDPYADGGEYEAPWADYRDDILQIVIEDNIESAGDFAFVDCPNCTSVTISQSVARIGTGAFRGCASLPQIDLPQGIKRIEDWAFNECDSLTSVVIPDGVVYLGSYCFAWCDSLISVTVPDSVTDGGINVFAEDDSLTNVTLGKGLTELPQGMFYSCPALKNIVVPEGVTDLSFCVFEECTALESISLPRSLTYIENEAFKGCNRLSTVRFSGTLAEWKKITIGNNNDYLINRTILCIDGNLAPATDPGTSTDPTPTNDSKPTADSKPTTDSKPITNPEPTVTVKPSTSKKSITKLKVNLSKTSFTYTGKSIRPTVKVMDGTKKLKKGTDYTLKYSNNKKVGKAYVIITGKGAYKGARRKYFKIIPKGTDLTGVSIGSHVVRWKKRKGITGYQIQYGRNSRFKGAKKITVKKSRTTSKAISDFKMGKWYYIRIRTYKTVRGKKYYSTWSDAMKFYWIHRR